MVAVRPGFLPTERIMLRNILRLRERRIADVMVPRADIIGVNEISRSGELMKVFESAGHSRLVVYDETLDDATGMVHIRDLVAFITVRAAASAKAKHKRKKPFPAGLDLKAVDLSMSLAAAKIIARFSTVRHRCRRSIFWPRCRRPASTLRSSSMNMGAPMGRSRSKISSRRSLARSRMSTMRKAPPVSSDKPDESFLADARTNLDDVTAVVGPEFEVGDIAKEVDTLAGYVVTRTGRVPVRGELVPGPGPFELEILDAELHIVGSSDCASTAAWIGSMDRSSR